MNINNSMSHKDQLYDRILKGLKVVENSYTDNSDGSATMIVDLTDDAASAWEELYQTPISAGFNSWFNDFLQKAMDYLEQKKVAENLNVSTTPDSSK